MPPIIDLGSMICVRTISGRMTLMRGVLAFALVLSLPALLLCAPAETASTPPHSACMVQPPGGQWNAAAQWVAGLSSSTFSPALTPEQRVAWNDFSKLSASDWTNLKRLYLDRIDVWRNRNLGNAPSREVAFYPFGGPDAANLLTFFPDAREFIMVGLEPVGCIPSAIADYTSDYFMELRHSLSSVVASGFFKTDDMRRDVTQSDLNGVLPLLLFLVSRAGYSITDVAPIGISPAGVVAPSASLAKVETSGVAIQFNDPRHGSRTLRYFSLNLENSRLKRKPGTTAYLKALPQTITLIKAASYLMHKPYFSTIRGTILTKSSVVVEEDSGIPYRYFDPAAWDVRLFGTYAEPIELFKDWSQDDLKAAYSAGTGVQPLDFAMGYRHRGQSNLLVAVRKTK
jgi:hypothetical protein